MTDPAPSFPLPDGRAMPALGFGTWRLAGPAAEAAVAAALSAGYRSFDTAAAYANEEGVGRGLVRSGLPRAELFVATKLWNDRHGYDEARRACEESLRRLGLDYVDLYLIHWPVPRRDRYVETWKAFVQLRKDGLARSIGVSNFNPGHLARVVDATGVVPAVNQVELHPLFQQTALRAEHERLGIRTEAWSPLGRRQVLDLPEIAQLARAHGRTPAQVVLAWHRARGFAAIPKSSHHERMRENWESQTLALPPEDLARIDALDRGRRLSGDPETFE